jgi:hypothetical protein
VTPTGILVALILVAQWFLVLTTWELRNWRGVALACAGTAVILLAGLLPWPMAGFIQAAVWGAVLWVLLLRTELVVVMSPKEYRFVSDYIEILRRFGRLKARALEIDSTAHVAEYESAVRSLVRLEAPADWAQLQADTVRELERRLTMMKLLHAKPADETLRVAEAQWREIMQRFRRMHKAKAGFWRGWPRLSRGPRSV